MSSQLADFYVQLSTKGYANAVQEIDAIKKALEDAEGPAGKLRKRLGELEKATAKPITLEAAESPGMAMAKPIGAAVAAIGAAAAAGLAMAKAGLQGSVQLEKWERTVDRLNMRMASLLLPVMEKAGAVIERFLASSADSFARLQSSVARIADVTMPIFEGSLVRLGQVLDRVVVPVMEKTAAAMEKAGPENIAAALSKAAESMMPQTGALGNIMSGLLGLLPEGEKKGAKPNDPVKRAGGFEDLQAMYKRIATTTLRTDKDKRQEDAVQKQVEIAAESKSLLTEIKEALNRLRPREG